MAQDTVDNSGWQNHLRYISVWGPLAAIQLSTIGGLGYFYGRLESIDQNNVIPPIITTTLKVEPAPVANNSYPMFEQTPKVTRAALHIPATLIEEPNALTMQVGKDFANETAKSNTASESSSKHIDSIKPTPKPLHNTQPTTSPTQTSNSNKALTLAKVVKVEDSTRKAKLDKADNSKALKKVQTLANVKPEVKEKSANKPVPKTEKPAKAPEEPLASKKAEKVPKTSTPKSAKLPKLVKAKREKLVVTNIEKPLKADIKPNKSVVKPQNDNGRWVYLGELRDYGWYGQKLHVSPNSGLPDIGQTYRTQLIHGTYDQPHGNRSMGGFQQGDVVQVENVQRETDGKVWAKLSKVHSVGRFDE